MQLRAAQGIAGANDSSPHLYHNEESCDVFAISPTDFTDEGVPISAFKLMLSIMTSDFKVAQQADEHLIGSVRKGPTKFPRMCALMCLLEIVGDIASKLLKLIVFEDGNFSRANSGSKKFISSDFVRAARQHVNQFLLTLPLIESRPIIYIDKQQVERAYNLYTYVETTTKMLFDTSHIDRITRMDEEKNATSGLSKKYVGCRLFLRVSKRIL